MLKQLSSSCAPTTSPQAEKPRKRAWLPLAAVILLLLVSRWGFYFCFGSSPKELLEYVQSFYYLHTIDEYALFCPVALFSFLLFGILWYKSTGRKRRIYYALFAFFAFQYGGGPVFYTLTFFFPFTPRTPAEYLVIFYAVWAAFLLAVLLYEFLSRKRR